MLRGVWRGRPPSYWFLSRLALGFGAIGMLGFVLFTVMTLTVFRDKLGEVALALLVSFASGAVLVTAGMLRRNDAKRWCGATGTRPPYGTSRE